MEKTLTHRVFSYAVLIMILAAAMVFGGVTPAQAQKGPGNLGPLTPNAPPNYGSTNLSPGFAPDPYTIDIGMGGTINAAEANPNCSGFVTAQPDFNLEWAGGQNAFFRVFSDATTIDTTLVVRTPTGQVLCNDDFANTLQSSVDVFNAAAGRYNIWVGTFSPGATGDAVLAITGQDIGPGFLPTPTLRPDQLLDYNLEPNFGTTTLSAGFTPDPFRLDMTSGGTVNVAYVGAECAGFATNAPDLRLQWSGSAPFLRVHVESAQDTTLVINAPDGNWYCNDDTFELNPSLDFPNATAGQYDIWVGSYSSASNAPATLFVTQVSQGPAATPAGTKGGGALDYNLAPINGMATLNSGFLPDPTTIQITAGGAVDPSLDASAASAGCSGMTTAAPTYRVAYTNTTNAALLRIYAESSDDTTLIVNAPDGNWHCVDDTFGLNPAVDFQNPQTGQYDIWVGVYGGGQTSAALGITEQSSVPGGALDYNLEPINGTATLSSGFTPDPTTVQITAGGSAYASAADSACAGLTTSEPTYRVLYDNTSNATFLRFYAESGDDLTLTINAPDGNWHCADDTFGTNPAVDFQNPPSGQYDIWVGTFSGGQTSATLGVTGLTTVPGHSSIPATPGAGGTLDYTLTPNYGSTTLRAGFQPDPFSLALVSGGSVSVSYLGAGCTGYASSAPDFSLNLDGAAQFLRFYVQAAEDTTLVVNTPDGAWQCNDDAFGSNPAVDLSNAVAGRYDIWVGSFDSSTSANAQLFITGLRTNQPR